jgi:hypothetical protein
VVLLGVVDDRALEVRGEDVAHDPHREVGLLEHQRGRGRLLDPLLQHLVELEQVRQLALEVGARRAVRRGADDRAAAAEVEPLDLLAQPRALAVVEPPRHADALAGRRVDHVAAGDRQLHGEPCALGLERVLDDLHDDLLPRLEQVGDARAALLAAAALHLLDAGEHDLVDVQEPVLLLPEVDERRFETGQDVVDLALVDVADDRPSAAALEVDLGDAVAGGQTALLAAARPTGGGNLPRGLEHRNPGLPPVDRDQHLLLHVDTSFEDGGPALDRGGLARLRVDRLQ